VAQAHGLEQLRYVRPTWPTPFSIRRVVAVSRSPEVRQPSNCLAKFAKWAATCLEMVRQGLLGKSGLEVADTQLRLARRQRLPKKRLGAL
jgi:hypothetical protein